MHASQILHADLLDIIFENRNKAYGAYDLRKFYNRKVGKALFFVFFLMTAFTLIVLNVENPIMLPTRIVEDPTLGDVLKDVQPVKPKANPQASKPSKQMSSKFVFVDSLQLDSLIVEDYRRVVSGAIGDAVSEPAFSAVQGGDAVLPIAPPTPPKPSIDISKPLEKADVDPSYPGGLKALTKFLERNLENPEELNDGESVSVKIKFVVGFDGELKAFEIKEDGGDPFNKEVIRVLKKMPRWIPGKANGQNVSVYFTIPVKFINGQ